MQTEQRCSLTETRSRTITWEDPRTIVAAARGKTGLETLREVIAGRLPPPPMGRLMNIRLTVANRGEIVFEGVPEEYHYNPMGIVHGGMAATLLDSALGCCVILVPRVGRCLDDARHQGQLSQSDDG